MDVAVENALNTLPENLRPPVELWFEQLADQSIEIPAELSADVARVVACSEFAANIIAREFEWFLAQVDSFQDATEASLFDDFERRIALEDLTEESLKSELRAFRNRILLRVLWRELHNLANLDETLLQLSTLADRTLGIATRAAEEQLRSRYGVVRRDDGEIVPLVILGMGKLGGRELNFSSDIDLIFCYSENGETDGDAKISAQEYFGRLSRLVIAFIDEVTVDGFVFRVDTRLRPFGESGPPVVSFAALESYLLQHGRDWERYAYVKARVVGALPSQAIVDELYSDLIQPFVYRRYLDFGVFESVREMQEMIAAEVRRRDLANNLKLGPGGIREAEFIVQALQLVRGGSEPSLQSRELQKVLPKLVSERGLTAADAIALRAAYRYLRRLENFIQAIRDQQTHDLPDSEIDRSRLCLAMGHANWSELLVALDKHRDTISAQFAAIAFRGERNEDPLRRTFRQLWKSQASEQQWAAEIGAAGDADAAILAARIVEFGGSSATQQVGAACRRRLQSFIPVLMSKVMASSRPVPALTRTLAITERILRRSAYLALLNENEQALSRLVDLCSRSEYIAEQMASYPALLDELLDPRSFHGAVTKSDLAEEMKLKLDAVVNADSEMQMTAIAQFQRAAMFRIAVEDFNDRLPIMKVSDGLTWLAELVLDEALRAAWHDMTQRHGAPCYSLDGKVHRAGFGIVGYGKLGGLELSYGSDLDIVFLHNSRGDKQYTDGEKSLDNALFFSRLVRRLVHFLTTQTGSGELYEVDTRLRPDGRSGLLVSSTEAFERYQEENAWTWEHQALLRARAVAGSAAIAAEFERIRKETLRMRVRRDQLRSDVISMRQRMRKEIDRSDAEVFDLKHGQGGIGDIEFLVQYLVLLNADKQSDLISFSDNIRQIDALIAAGILSNSSGEKAQNIYKDYRLEAHRLVLDGKKALCRPQDFIAEREFVAALWDDWLA
jgi:glutamate-ammonia-ligase adenylyltransferase